MKLVYSRSLDCDKPKCDTQTENRKENWIKYKMESAYKLLFTIDYCTVKYFPLNSGISSVIQMCL